MFSDPQSLTINAVATSLPRVAVEGSSATYLDATGNLTLSVSHARKRRKRSVIRVDQKKIAADPLIADRNAESSMSVYLVLDAPLNGAFTNTEQGYLVASLTKFLTDTSGAATTKLVAGES